MRIGPRFLVYIYTYFILLMHPQLLIYMHVLQIDQFYNRKELTVVSFASNSVVFLVCVSISIGEDKCG